MTPFGGSHRSRVSLTLVTLVAATASTASAADPDFRALSDTREVPTEAEAEPLLRALRPAVCPRGGPAALRPVSRGRAVRSAERLLRKRVPRKAYARFLRSKRARKPAVAEDLGAAGVAARAPAMSLAGFLAAHEREPRNPRHLLNASVMLTRLEKPREALALIAAAERLPKPRRMPMGIGVRPLALNARGFALIALRRFGDAERVLRDAARIEPLLAEAKLNLAAARLCAGRISQAVAPYIEGQRRRSVGAVQIAGVQPLADSALDLSFGKAATLPVTRIPPTPEDGVASAPGWASAKEQRYAEADQLFQKANQGIVDMSAHYARQPLVEAQRAGQILAMFNERYRQRPDLKAKKDAIVATADQLTEIYFQWQNEYEQIRTDCQAGNPTSDEIGQCIRTRCPPATAGHHARWLEVIKAADQMTREWAKELNTYATGLAANYSTPVYRRAIVLATQHEIMTIYASHIVLQIESWTGAEETLKDECTGSPGEAAAEEGNPEFPLPDLCPPGLASVKFAFSVGFASFGVNCEAVSVELSLPKPVSPFVQVTYGFGTGTTSVFAGAKAGAKIPGVSGGVRAGVTLSFDGAGNLTDVGIRGAASVAGPGLPNLPGTAPKLSAQVDYSLAPALL